MKKDWKLGWLFVTVASLVWFCGWQLVLNHTYQKRLDALEKPKALAINHFIDHRAVCSLCQAKDPNWHYTPHADGRRIFVLCEDCWKSLTPQQRIPHYKSLVEEYWPNASEEWPPIRDSILAGL